MPQTASLSANARTTTGKGVARTLRRAGRVPAVIYGRGRDPEALDLDATALERLLARVSALTTLVDVTVADRTPIKALIREIQRNPTRPSDILHVDFYEVHADEAISVEVPIAFTGVADGVRNGGGVFEALRHELEILVLPGDIPDKIEVDVTALVVGQSLHVRDIRIEKGELLTDAGVTLCTIVAAKVEEAPVEPGIEVEATTEPELIRKPKPTDEEEAE